MSKILKSKLFFEKKTEKIKGKDLLKKNKNKKIPTLMVTAMAPCSVFRVRVAYEALGARVASGAGCVFRISVPAAASAASAASAAPAPRCPAGVPPVSRSFFFVSVPFFSLNCSRFPVFFSLVFPISLLFFLFSFFHFFSLRSF